MADAMKKAEVRINGVRRHARPGRADGLLSCHPPLSAGAAFSCAVVRLSRNSPVFSVLGVDNPLRLFREYHLFWYLTAKKYLGLEFAKC